MVAQPIEDFLTPDFLRAAAKELASVGFVSDEHGFAPYRETISKHCRAIESALSDAGVPFHLQSGFVKHIDAGYAYFVYNTDHFRSNDDAEAAVGSWLDAKYSQA
jgi:hypothetical protein